MPCATAIVWDSLNCFMQTWLFKFLPAPKSMLHQFVKYFTSERRKREKGEKNTIKKQNDSRFHTVWQAFQCVTNGKGSQQSEREKAKQCEQDSCCMCGHILKLCKKGSNVFVTCLFSASLVYFSVVFSALFLSLSLSLACCFTQIVLYGLNTPLAYAMIMEKRGSNRRDGRNDNWSACCR